MTYIVIKTWEVLVRRNANLHRYRLKFHGAISRSGGTFLVLAAVGILFVVHSGVVRGAMVSARRLDRQAFIPLDRVLAGETMDAETAALADRAMARYRVASALGAGGIALCGAYQPEIDLRASWFEMAAGDFDAAEATLRAAIERDGRSEAFCRNLLIVIRTRDGAAAAWEYARRVLAEEPGYGTMFGEAVDLAAESGRVPDAQALARERFERWPEDGPTLHWLPLLLLEGGEAEEAVMILEHRLELNPKDLAAHQLLASVEYRLGRSEAALETMAAAVGALPREPGLRHQYAELLDLLGRPLEADEQRGVAAGLSDE